MYKFFDKKARMGASVNEVALHKLMIRKFKRWNIYAIFKGNIWVKNSTEMGSFSPKNRGVKYLLDVFTKYACIKHLANKKAKTVLHVFIEIVNESKR